MMSLFLFYQVGSQGVIPGFHSLRGQFGSYLGVTSFLLMGLALALSGGTQSHHGVIWLQGLLFLEPRMTLV